MRWHHRAATLTALALVATFGVLGQPSPPAAHANVACNALSGAAKGVSGGVEAMTGGAVAFGNPVGDVCNDVTGGAGDLITNPLKGALQGVGKSIFAQITEWVSEGSAWLIGEVARGIDETTTPKLTGAGFLTPYRRMAEIAALMGLAMLVIAIIEGAAQGSVGTLVRVALFNLPLALIATSVAYVVVQLLLVATDGLCQAISGSGHKGSQEFFKAAISGLGEVGGTAGRNLGAATPNPAGAGGGEAGGALAAPLFVSFLLAIVGAFAAFLVWLELLMRDAAVYVTALFTPFALAAAIHPRWGSALRRTCELLVVVIGSKFVIVSIIVLAAGLIAHPEGRVEAIVAASALMVLAAFAPFVLLKLVPFAEGAMNAAYNRRSASGGMVGGVQLASGVQMLRGMSRSNWGGSGVTLWEAADKGGGVSGGDSGGARTGAKGSGVAGAGESAGAGMTATAGGAAGGAAGAVAGAAAKAPAAAARGAAKSGAERLEGYSEASGGGNAGSPGSSSPGHAEDPRPSGNAEQAARGKSNPSSETSPAPAKSPSEPEPSEAPRDSSETPPRPAPEGSEVKPERGEEG
jgi:hypothetical protein